MTTTSVLPIYRRSELEAIADGCLLRYRALYVDGVDDSSDISLIGVAFARVKHEYILRLVEKNLPQDAEEARAAFIEGVAITQLPARLVPELRDLWEFHTSKFALAVERFVATEEHGTAGEVGFTPDLVLAHPDSNTLEIIDDKSGYRPPLTEIELKGNFQARVYSRYARDRWPHFSAYHFTIFAVRFNRRTTVSFTQAELDTVDVEIQAAIATIELAKAANAWPAIPGPACRFCTLKCPVADNAMSLPKRLSLDQRLPVAEWLLVADKQLRAMKKLLKESVTANGPISVRGVVWDNRPTESRAYAIDAVLEVFRKLKIDRQAADVMAAGGDLTISHSSLSKIFRLYPDAEAMLANFVRTKTGYRFGAQKAGEIESDDD